MKRTNSPPTTNPSRTNTTAIKLFYFLPVLCVLGLMGFLVWNRATHQAPPVRPISTHPFATVPIDGLKANFFTSTDRLIPSGNDVFIEFRDTGSNLVDVGAVTFEMQMKMPDMVMHSIGKVFRTATAGQYRTTVEPQMAGDWIGTIGFAGAHGKAETNFTATVK